MPGPTAPKALQMPPARLPSSQPRPPALSPIRRPSSTADEVEERLILAIALGDKQPGDRLTETEVAAAMAVSRVPVREAMQRLQLRGILVGHGLRGMQVADFSPCRIAEVYELRSAIERIFIAQVMSPDFDSAPLLAKLEALIDRMAALAGGSDPVALSVVDLEFHRTIAAHSGRMLAAQIWEGLAQHLLIVFCRDWSFEADRAGEVAMHRRLLEFLRGGDPADIDRVLAEHFTGPALRRAICT